MALVFGLVSCIRGGGFGQPYDHPKASMGLVSLLVEALVLRHLVLSIDQAMSKR